MKTSKTTFFLTLLLSMAALSSCKKDKAEPKTKAIASDWFTPKPGDATSDYTNPDYPYYFRQTDSKITADIISKGKVVAYVKIAKGKQVNYYRLKYTSTNLPATKIDFSATNGRMDFLINFDPADPPVVGGKYSYRYILIPEGVEVPAEATLNDYNATITALGLK